MGSRGGVEVGWRYGRGVEVVGVFDRLVCEADQEVSTYIRQHTRW